MRRIISAVSGAAFLLAIVGHASAVSIAPGGFISPLPGTTVAAEPQLAGAEVVEDVVRTLTGNFTTTNEPYEVRVQDRVIRSVDGTYDFYYGVTLVEKPDVYPLGISRNGFAGYATNVGYRLDGLGTLAPGDASRTIDGDSITFGFGFNQPEGGVTRFVFVDTDATWYGLNATGAIDLSPSFDVNARPTFATFGPAVPEPAAIGIFGAITAATAVRRRRRTVCNQGWPHEGRRTG